MAIIRLFYEDGGQFQSGVIDTSAPSGRQCLTNPDPQTFASFDELSYYSSVKGEALQQVTLEQANAMCAGEYISPYALQQTGVGPGCCCPPGGGPITKPPDPSDVFPGLPPGESGNSFNYQRGIINRTQRLPINTVSTT